MQTQLKDLIINHVQYNTNEFQLINHTIDYFKEYIYSKDGNYLICGEQVAQFITDFINLYKN